MSIVQVVAVEATSKRTTGTSAAALYSPSHHLIFTKPSLIRYDINVCLSTAPSVEEGQYSAWGGIHIGRSSLQARPAFPRHAHKAKSRRTDCQKMKNLLSPLATQPNEHANNIVIVSCAADQLCLWQ